MGAARRSAPMTKEPLALPDSVDAVVALLATENYVCDRRLATALFLSLKLARPLFLEGEPGVGKTELAKTLAAALNTALLRVQCYEGLDIAQTAYEWNVARQMVEIRLAEAAHAIHGEGDRERHTSILIAPGRSIHACPQSCVCASVSPFLDQPAERKRPRSPRDHRRCRGRSLPEVLVGCRR